jgi:hypothetical protein
VGILKKREIKIYSREVWIIKYKFKYIFPLQRPAHAHPRTHFQIYFRSPRIQRTNRRKNRPTPHNNGAHQTKEGWLTTTANNGQQWKHGWIACLFILGDMQKNKRLISTFYCFTSISFVNLTRILLHFSDFIASYFLVNNSEKNINVHEK